MSRVLDPRGALALSAMFALCASARADVRLANVFQSGMVLQRDAQVRVYGTAAPGEHIVIENDYADNNWTGDADASGNWSVAIHTSGPGRAYKLVVRGTANRVELTDVLFGEVWLCSGQSNMEMPVGFVHDGYSGVRDWQKEIAAAQYPEIRCFTVENAIAALPAAECNGRWQACTPEVAKNFSATAYFFARELQRDLKVPIGLIASDWGGTPAEGWTSAETLANFPEFAPAVAKLATDARDPAGVARRLADERKAWRARFDEVDRGVSSGYAKADFDDHAWPEMNVPSTWSGELADHDGVVWMRRHVDIPAAWAGRDLVLELGPIDDLDTTFVNGVQVGEYMTGTAWNTPRVYPVPSKLVHAGANVIAVRALDTGGRGGINGPTPADVRLHAATGTDSIALAGAWRWQRGARMQDLPAAPSETSVEPWTPSALYNGMIAPLTRFTIRGALWYQGESNRERAALYARLFPAMITDWRAKFGLGDFPFYFVQIAPFDYGGDTGEAGELREAQQRTLRLASTGMAVTCDIGESGDIHPKNKQEVGRRLALCALTGTYGRKVESSGPTYREQKIEGASIRVAFDHASGLSAKDEKPSCFTIAGADGKFVPAEARIDGETIVVASASVPAPRYVRFAQGAVDMPNLHGASGLPAAPFRTDDLPWITALK